MTRAAAITVLAAVFLFGTARAAENGNAYHGPDNKPRWLTTNCVLEDDDNCYWNAGTQGDGTGHSFWAIPLGNQKVAVVYWNPTYNNTHGYVTNR